MPEWFEAAQTGLLAWLETHQYLGLAIYVGIEEAGVPFPVPADTAIFFMGIQVFRGEANPFVVVAIVVASATAGASVLYWVSRLIGPRLIDRFGRVLHITPERHARAERWFQRYQAPAVVIGRLIPGFRIVITVVAGVARGNFLVFLPSAALSALIWALIYMSLGWVLGRESQQVVEAVSADPRLGFGIALGVVTIIAALLALRFRRRLVRRTPEPEKERTPEDSPG